MIQKMVNFKNKSGAMLHGHLRIPGYEDMNKTYPVIIVCHNFRSNKEREIITSLWDTVSRSQFVAFRFDFSGHGESEGDFKNFSVSKQIEDLKAAIEYVKTLKQVDPDRIGLVGHGMGAVVGLLCAADETFGKNIHSIFSIGGISSMQAFIDAHLNPHQYKQLMEKGYHQFSNFEEVRKDFVEDMNKHDIIAAVESIECPTFFMHAGDDINVNYSHARELFNHAIGVKEIDIVEDANHDFSDETHREYLLDSMIVWFRKTLPEHPQKEKAPVKAESGKRNDRGNWAKSYSNI